MHEGNTSDATAKYMIHRVKFSMKYDHKKTLNHSQTGWKCWRMEGLPSAHTLLLIYPVVIQFLSPVGIHIICIIYIVCPHL